VNIQRDVCLQHFHTFGVAVSARHFCEVSSREELREALDFGRAHALPVMILGGGSNVLFREDYPGLIIRMCLSGIQLVSSTGDAVEVRAEAGENWHGFVLHCLAQGWHGLENLALIPGCVGAAPIQNIGAYGVEVKERITEVEVLDIGSGSIRHLSANECSFGYRDSVFKNALRGRAVVLSVTFALQRDARVEISYGTLATELAAIADPTPRDVLDAVCRIRRARLPDPGVLGNAGSFFKNPVIAESQYQRLRERFPQMPAFAVDGKTYNNGTNNVKVPAAWLIEQAGWKGRVARRAAVYERQPLVLVNLGGATANEITALAFDVIDAVSTTFGIRLEPEVQWIPALTDGPGTSQH